MRDDVCVGTCRWRGRKEDTLRNSTITEGCLRRREKEVYDNITHVDPKHERAASNPANCQLCIIYIVFMNCGCIFVIRSG
jgi:hypothetical protein